MSRAFQDVLTVLALLVGLLLDYGNWTAIGFAIALLSRGL